VIQQAVAEGANLIQQQGDAGLDESAKHAWGNKMVHKSYIWMFAIEPSAEQWPACRLQPSERSCAARLTTMIRL